MCVKARTLRSKFVSVVSRTELCVFSIPGCPSHMAMELGKTISGFKVVRNGEDGC